MVLSSPLLAIFGLVKQPHLIARHLLHTLLNQVLLHCGIKKPWGEVLLLLEVHGVREELVNKCLVLLIDM